MYPGFATVWLIHYQRLWNVIINRLLASVILMQLLMVLSEFRAISLCAKHSDMPTTAIGLQLHGFRSLYWISTVPAIFITLGFKMYCARKFNPAFDFYIPSQDELRAAHVHSQRADNAGNRLEKRFGHPALHQELFTPMVHANMTHLLSEVFQGKIGSAKTKLDEYGGTNVDAHVVAGGIKIAGIAEVSSAYPACVSMTDLNPECA